MDSSIEKEKLTNNKKSFEKFFSSSGRKPKIFQSDDEEEFVKKFVTEFLNKSEIGIFRCSSEGAAFAATFKKTVGGLLKLLLLEK